MARNRRVHVVWGAAADLDLGRIHEYLSSRSPSASRRLFRRLVTAARRLEANPSLGSVAMDVEPIGTFRHVVVWPYRLFYQVEGETVTIVRVWDGRRNPGDLRVPASAGSSEGER
jgi:plasmid stabilization system protein ParE